jgi:hypothetical protein
MNQLILTALSLTILVSCTVDRAAVQKIEPANNAPKQTLSNFLPELSYKKPEEFDFQLIIKGEPSLTQTEKIYYRVFIDKEEIGRTSIGIPGEEKSLDAMISPDSHILTIEKYQLDERKGKYVKLKNIEQPKPDFFTFSLPGDRIIIINIIDKGAESDAVFSSSFAAEEVFKQNK